MRAKVLITILLLMAAGALGKAYAANLPLYVRYLAYTPPNLYLRAARATQAFYVPINSGTTFNFDLDPVVAGTLSLAEGPIPVTISAYRIPANCSGNKTVTVTIQYNIGGVFTLIGSETQVLNIPTTGPIVTSFAFNNISSASSFVLQTGDFVRMTVMPSTNRLCLVNEFPLAGTDADASHAVLQTGPILTVSKTSAVISDPINGTTGPKAIPGSISRYTVSVDNDALASDSGQNVIVSDPIPTDSVYVAETITLDTGGGPVSLTDAADADAGEFDGTNVIVDAGAVAPGNNATVTFDVTIP